MLNKKIIKVLSVILLVAILVVTLGSSVFAAGISEQFEPDTTTIANSQINGVIKTILGAFKWVGVAIAVGMLIYLGIKYVTSAPDGKANLKGQLGIYILGFVFIVAATTIVGILETTLAF